MLDSLQKAFQEQIRDLYSAESQLTKALPRMAKKASTESLRDAFTAHLDETRGHVERLQQVADMLGFKPSGKKCRAMEGLIEEGKEVLEEEGEESVLDLALIAAAQRVEHYEIAAYTSACAMAEQLGHKKVLPILEQSLDEENAADEKLGTICSDEVLPAAANAGVNDEDEEQEGTSKSAAPAASKRGRTPETAGRGKRRPNGLNADLAPRSAS